MAESPQTFGGLLRGLRKGAGLTQEELAEAAGQLRQALEIFRRIGAAEAAEVAAELPA